MKQFNREKIDENFNLKERKNGSKFKKLVKEPNYQKIVDLLTDGKVMSPKTHLIFNPFF